MSAWYRIALFFSIVIHVLFWLLVLYATPKVTKYQRCNFTIQIHKFTVKIDTISINLLFECVKIAEFNFNSHVFPVMYQDQYQDIRFLNRDACFLNQEERRQFLIISVSERDWKREHRLEFKMASDRFYIPNASEFFEGLLSLLQHCGDCVKENTDGGHAEFLARRQEEYQRTLCDLWVMYGRVTESAQENQLTQDLELLMQVMDSRLQSLAKLNSDFHYQGTTEEVKHYAEFTVTYSRKVR